MAVACACDPSMADRVRALHDEGLPDHRIALRLRVSDAEATRLRRRLRLEPHPPDCRVTQEFLWKWLEQWDDFLWKKVKFWADRYPEFDIEDLHNEAVTVCLHSGDRFDPTKPSERTGRPVLFQSYVGLAIDNWLKRYVQREAMKGFSGSIPLKEGEESYSVKKAPTHSVDALRGDDLNGTGLGWEPSISDREQTFRDLPPSQANQWWERILRGLPERHSKVLYFKYRLGASHEVIARAFRTSGLQRAKVGETLSEAKDHVRRMGIALELA